MTEHKWKKMDKIGRMQTTDMESMVLDQTPQVVSIGQARNGQVVVRYYVQIGTEQRPLIVGRHGSPLSWGNRHKAQAYLDEMVSRYQTIRTAREEGLAMYWDVEVWGLLFDGYTRYPVRYAQVNVKADTPETAVMGVLGNQWCSCHLDSITYDEQDEPYALMVADDPDKTNWVLSIPGMGVNHYATPVDLERLYWLNGKANTG